MLIKLLNKKSLLVLLPIFLLLLYLTGCSNSKGVSTKVKTYNIAVSNASKPLSYSENGQLKGYEVDVLNAVEKKIKNVKFNFNGISQTAELLGLDSKKYDLAANGFYSNPERAKKYLISKENDGLSLVKIYYNKNKVKHSINNLSDLSELKVAPVNPNGGMFNLLTTWNKSHSKKITINTSDQLPLQQLLKDLNDGKYDALIDPSNLGENDIINGSKLNNIKISDAIKAFPTFFLYTKDNSKLRSQVDDALRKLKNDGTLSKLSKKYFGENVFQYKSREN